MKALFGVFGLLAVSVMVGIFAVTELHQITDAAGGPGAVISATAKGATPPSEMQQPDQNSIEVSVYQTPPILSFLDDD